jgi:hypothetical protein
MDSKKTRNTAAMLSLYACAQVSFQDLHAYGLQNKATVVASSFEAVECLSWWDYIANHGTFDNSSIKRMRCTGLAGFASQ